MPSTSLHDGIPSRLGLAVVALVATATWALSHPYAGIFHDAGLYTLQALARLHSDSLPNDVFLKFGSQDGFTLFSPLYAAAMKVLGVEPAAAALTLTFQLALLMGAWVLVRGVLPLPTALLGFAVFIAVPGDYGADRIFTCIEPFLTPRMAAEALVLGGLAAALSDKKWLAAALTLAAALLHPIMAMAGVAALVCLYLGKPKPLMTAALAIVGLKALALAAFVMPTGEWGRFDAPWLTLVTHRSPYLFIRSWQLDDWARAAVSAATLVVAGNVLSNPRARTLALLALVTMLSGIVLTFIACDVLHLVLVTQLQPWRCQWLGTVVAALLFPASLHALWSNRAGGAATALLLAAAWIFAADVYALSAAAAALAALAFLQRLKPGEARWVFWGACGMLAIALTWRVASNLEFTESHYLDPAIPLWLRRAMSFTRDGTAPAAVMASAWWLAGRRRGLPALLTLAAFAAAGCALLIPHTIKRWTAQEFPPQQVAQFANFRARMPADSEVFWPESPVSVWMLLGRPSYLSVIQTSGLVFSRRTAFELERRADALSSSVNPGSFMNWNNAGTGLTLERDQLLQVCKTGEFGFLVTTADLGGTPVAAVQSATGPASKRIRLYRCQALAAAAAT